MRNLPVPTRDGDKDDLKKALKSYHYKGKACGYTATDDEVDALLALYDEYDDKLAVPSEALKGDGLSVELTKALDHAYGLTQKNRKLHRIRDLVFSDVEFCPICGIGPPVELDHYLPQSDFKPLAIYVRNLVPLCHACNHAKLAVFSEIDEERFLHAYFDLLPNVQFLNVVISIQEEALVARFEINPAAGLAVGLNARLSYQMAALHLNDRYQGEINTYVSGHAVALHMAYGANGKAGVQSFLELQARHERNRFHRNHWRPSLLKALTEHDEFCDGGFSIVLPVSPDIAADVAGLANP